MTVAVRSGFKRQELTGPAPTSDAHPSLPDKRTKTHEDKKTPRRPTKTNIPGARSGERGDCGAAAAEAAQSADPHR